MLSLYVANIIILFINFNFSGIVQSVSEPYLYVLYYIPSLGPAFLTTYYMYALVIYNMYRLLTERR